MHMHAAGSAIEAPIMILLAVYTVMMTADLGKIGKTH